MKIVLIICGFLIFIGWIIFLAMHGDYYFPAPDGGKALLRDELFRLSER